jgi:hypothetical protein
MEYFSRMRWRTQAWPQMAKQCRRPRKPTIPEVADDPQ